MKKLTMKGGGNNCTCVICLSCGTDRPSHLYMLRPPVSTSSSGCSEMLMAKVVSDLANRTAGKEAVAMESFAKALMMVRNPPLFSLKGSYRGFGFSPLTAVNHC